MDHAYIATTRAIRVSVKTFFLPDQSKPAEGKFFWAYQVKIENQGGETVQLLRRTWKITDGRGRTQQVSGEGVVGKQPVLPQRRTDHRHRRELRSTGEDEK